MRLFCIQLEAWSCILKIAGVAGYLRTIIMGNIWGLPAMSVGQANYGMTVLNTTYRCIKPAARVGKTRPMRMPSRTMQTNPSVECYLPVWTPKDVISWSSTALVLEAHTEVTCGALPSQAGHLQPLPGIKVKGRYQNQI